jgi:hypothetical protein
MDLHGEPWTGDRMRVTELELASSVRTRAQVVSFYVDDLQFEVASDGAIRMGESRLLFSEVETNREPFYHFALLVPGDRFTPALEWLKTKTSLLSDPETGSDIFDFDSWDALACYFHDPAGNIVECIAHRGLEETSREGPFTPSEVVGFSEVGLVCLDKRVTAKALEDRLGVTVWDGSVEDPRRLAFVGERGRTLILCPSARPWLPTDRSAEIHPTRIVLDDVASADLQIPQSPHVIVGRAGR